MARHLRSEGLHFGDVLLADLVDADEHIDVADVADVASNSHEGRHFVSRPAKYPGDGARHFTSDTSLVLDDFGRHWRDELGAHVRKTNSAHFRDDEADGFHFRFEQATHSRSDRLHIVPDLPDERSRVRTPKVDKVVPAPLALRPQTPTPTTPAPVAERPQRLKIGESSEVFSTHESTEGPSVVVPIRKASIGESKPETAVSEPAQEPSLPSVVVEPERPASEDTAASEDNMVSEERSVVVPIKKTSVSERQAVIDRVPMVPAVVDPERKSATSQPADKLVEPTVLLPMVIGRITDVPRKAPARAPRLPVPAREVTPVLHDGSALDEPTRQYPLVDMRRPLQVVSPKWRNPSEPPPIWAFDDGVAYSPRQPGRRPSPAVAVLGAVLVASALVHAHAIGQWDMPFSNHQLAAVTGLPPVSVPGAPPPPSKADAAQEIPSDSIGDPAQGAPTTVPVPTTPPPPTTPQRQFISPIPGGRMTSGFGNRLDPVLGGYRLHAGIDFAVPTGTSIHAAAAGKVIQAGWESGYGNYTCILHDNGISTCYAHQSKILVHKGQQVTQGQLIGVSGNTGASTGPHLHFEVRINGRPVNPLNYL